MSPHAVNSFVTDLVEMAKAVEELPAVKDSLVNATAENAALLEIVQQRELRIMDLKTEVELLHGRIRSLEVARDDAELRFLELEETAHMVRRVLNDIADSSRNQANQLTAAIDPPKPQPIAEPTPPPVVIEERAEAEPVPVESPYWNAPVTEQGQSESHPTASEASSGNGESVQSPIVQSENASPQPTTDSWGSASSIYSGRRYIDVPGFISRSDWLAGGGTDADYDWREGEDTRYRA